MLAQVTNFGEHISWRTSKYAVSAKFGESTFPDVGWICVMVPKKTESMLRFSARLHEGASAEVYFERIFYG
jgi:hypothetical protein